MEPPSASLLVMPSNSAVTLRYLVSSLTLCFALPTSLTNIIVYMFSVNKRRDKVYGPRNKERSDEAGMRDQTEFENKDFRYVL